MKLRNFTAAGAFALALCLAISGASFAQDAAKPAEAAAAATTVPAPKAPRERNSPHETINGRMDGNMVTITYGRPNQVRKGQTEARKIWGGVVPYEQVWRTGADEATTLITQKPLMFGDKEIPAGVYTLNTFISERGTSQLIIGTQLGAWGIPYTDDAKNHELARIDMKKATVSENVPQFTITIEKGESGASELKLTWETTQFSVPFSVKK